MRAFRDGLALKMALAIFVCLLVRAERARGDVLVMQDGSRFAGTITEENDQYVVTFPNGGTMRIPKSKVREIVSEEAILADFESMEKKVDLKDDSQVSRLAKFAFENGLEDRRAKLLLRAYETRLATSAGDPKVIRALGRWCQRWDLKRQATCCEFWARVAEADLGDNVQVTALSRFAIDNRLQEEARTMLASAFKFRRGRVDLAKVDEVEGLAQFASKYGLDEERRKLLDDSAQIRREAARSIYEVRFEGVDLADDTQVDGLLEFAKKNGLSAEHQQTLQAAYKTRLAAAGNDAERLLRLRDWCSRYEPALQTEWKECNTLWQHAAFAGKMAEAGGNLVRLDEVATWCQSQCMWKERDQALECAYGEATKAAASVGLPEARAAIAMWGIKWKKYDWADEQVALISNVLLAQQDATRLFALQGSLATLVCLGHPEALRCEATCLEALYKLCLDGKVEATKDLARAAELCRDCDLVERANELEAMALKPAPEDVEVRRILSHVRDPASGRWVRQPWRVEAAESVDVVVRPILPGGIISVSPVTRRVFTIQIRFAYPPPEGQLARARLVNAKGKTFWPEAQSVKMKGELEAEVRMAFEWSLNEVEPFSSSLKLFGYTRPLPMGTNRSRK